MLMAFINLLLLPLMVLNLPLVRIGFNNEVPRYQQRIVGYTFLVEAALIGILALLVSL